ncbi:MULTISPECIES: DUF1189 domain-containing protein [Vagococcus]|uniref:Conserved domain protein n=1 Tax=Vagococcus fluvialis bH819 TaxID=1255619 RepID=A0A1X6WQP1_9ENTE|nr:MULTISPECIES: DUF1189 domain-containing protein [Vagococcus]SLM85966.1 conserved domain protein [Vagococcus fluvialis bH819]HCM88333.1 DUF1189 domain-containing protein [Vagococcus sp.]
MSTFKLIQATFKQPSLLIEARKKKGFHVFLFMLLLSIVLSLPTVIQSMHFLDSLKEDGDKIIQKVPEFSITDGTLKTDKKDSGFIYQTNSMIFTFDPDGKRNKKDIETDASRGLMTVALLKNEIVLVLPTVGSTADVLDSSVLSLPYTTPQLKILNKDFLTNMLTDDSRKMILFVFVLLTSGFVIFLSLLFDLIVMTFFANLFTKLKLINLKFGEIFKILVYCATIPTILTMLLQFLWPSLSIGSAGLALTLLIYFNIFPKNKKIK